MRRPNSTKRPKMDRRAAADVLAEERAKRSDKEQLAILDQRLGEGVGAKRERDRLLGRIASKS